MHNHKLHDFSQVIFCIADNIQLLNSWELISFFSVMDLSQLTEINLLQSLQLHNTTFAGVQQKPGPHSPSPAAFFSGNSMESDLLYLFINIDCVLGSSRAVYYSSNTRDSITSLIQSSKEFSFLTSIRQNRQNTGTIFAFSYGKYQTNR